MTSTKPIISIAFTGHVSNGKSTIVNALTGIDTKKNSEEKKSGKTIRLGYANGRIWVCKNCNNYEEQSKNCYNPSKTFITPIRITSQKEENQICRCNNPLTPEYDISFLDCPGHHSYVTTMIKGTTNIDCAILVTDVRKEKLQIQTIEHLAILTILGVKRIIVVQNKIDLVSKEIAFKHYHMLKQELKDTAAEYAPIIPLSAQKKIGLNNLIYHIRNMCKSVTDNYNPINKKLFSIIRSFNVNKPFSDIETLKGGVLGGCIRGIIPFKAGDEVEIRPGLLRNSNDGKKLISVPLFTTITEIRTEEKKCEETIPGGLYGIQTNLDPSLCKNDKLVGSFCGRSCDLPPIQDEIKLIITYIVTDKDGDKNKIKKNIAYKLVIGNVVVLAIANDKKNGIYTFSLLSPICTLEKTVLIYQVESSNTKLIAFGVSQNEKKNELEIDIDNEVEEDSSDYLRYLNDVFIDQTEKKFEKTKLPLIQLARENRNTLWINFLDYTTILKREETQIVNYVKEELCIEANISSNGMRLYKTKISSSRLQNVLSGFIKEFVLCRECLSLDTDDKNCLSCGATRRIY